MTTEGRKSSLPLLLGVVATFMVAFFLTRIWTASPWRLTVDFEPDPEATEADLSVLERALTLLPPKRRAEGPDIVLVVLDTVRADHLELYGHPWSTMPRLTRWASEGVIYENALSNSAWTLPAHASLFTGLLPIVHSADGEILSEEEMEHRVKRKEALHKMREIPLADEAVTVAERLRDRGYRTIGVAANQAYLQRWYNLDQGFDIWLCDDLVEGRDRLPYIRGDRITNLALAATARVREIFPDQPIFLFVNYMDAHGPYVPRTSYVRDEDRLTWRFRSGPDRERIAIQILAQRRKAPPGVLDAWKEAYDAELRFLDEQLGRLLAGLAEQGIDRDAWFAITSDHGEYFGEHDLLAHSKDVYQEVLHIPLVLRGSGLVPGREKKPIQLDDLARILVSWGNAEPLPTGAQLEGIEIAELYGSRIPDFRNARMRRRFNRVRRAFFDGPRKVILGSDGSFEAYDLSVDPRETTDRSHEAWAIELAQRAREWLEQTPERPWKEKSASKTRKLDPRATHRLRALGYLD